MITNTTKCGKNYGDARIIGIYCDADVADAVNIHKYQ